MTQNEFLKQLHAELEKTRQSADTTASLQAKQEAARLGVEITYTPEETEELAKAAKLAPIADGNQWRAGLWLASGTIVIYRERNYQVLQGHVAQGDWLPDKVPALFSEIKEASSPWVQPLGAHDAYRLGDIVTYKGKVWLCTADYNAWEPGVYGWEAEDVKRS